jgi:manganese oxidase
MAGPDGRPKDVDREFVTLFMIVDENTSWYLQHNIDTYTTDPKGVNKLEASVSDDAGNFFAFGAGFSGVNFRSTINGLMFANMPIMTMKKGGACPLVCAYHRRVRQYPHPTLACNVVLHDGRRTDVILIGPAQMETVDMVPDDPGTWMYHCHVDEHMLTGMTALYKVEP